MSTRRDGGAASTSEARGRAACVQRDALFRRMLLAADAVGFIGAFALTVALSRRSPQLIAAIAAVPILAVCTKFTGLYDPDGTPLRKALPRGAGPVASARSGRRLELASGVTREWQIRGPARVPLADMVALDYLYVATRSFWNYTDKARSGL